MKLSKMELDALATKLQKELNDTADAAQQDLNKIQDLANMPKAKLVLRRIQSLDTIIKKYIDNDRATNPTLTGILRSMRTTQTLVKTSGRYNCSEIRDALIIAQIGSPDVDGMIESVKKQFMA